MTPWPTSRGRRRGSSSRRRRSCSPPRTTRPWRCWPPRPSQMEAPTAVEGIHFGVLERLVAVGGQQVTPSRDGCGLRGGVPPAVRRPPGPQRGRRARRGRVLLRDHIVGRTGPSSREAEPAAAAGPIDIRDAERRPRASPPTSPCPRPAGAWTPWWCVRVSRRSPRRAGSRSCAGRPRWSSTPPTTCRARRRWPRPIADSFAFTSSVAVVGILADKDAAGILAALDPIVDMVVITRSSSPRALPVAELAAIAAEVLGEERVEAVDRLDDCPGSCDRAGGGRARRSGSAPV